MKKKYIKPKVKNLGKAIDIVKTNRDTNAIRDRGSC